VSAKAIAKRELVQFAGRSMRQRIESDHVVRRPPLRDPEAKATIDRVAAARLAMNTADHPTGDENGGEEERGEAKPQASP